MQSPVSALVVKTMVFVALWCGLSSTAAAQSALTGIVHDQSGLVVVNAKVVVTDAVTGKVLPQAWTNNIGYYELEVAPGDYRIHVEQNGLVYDGMVRVYPNEKAALDITIAYYRTEQLTVPANSLESSTTMANQAGLGATFNRNAIEASALSNGRVLLSFLNGVSGVVATDSNGTLNQFTADGQRRSSNRTTIDGVSGDLAIDVRNVGFGLGDAGSGVLPAVSVLGGTQTIVPLDATEQIQIKTTDTTPQDARAPGAQTIVITRAGTDRFSGNGFLDWRPESLGAGDWFGTSTSPDTFRKSPTSSQTGGLSAGGPIVSQQLYYFAALEHQQINRPLAATLKVPSSASRGAASPALSSLLDALPEPNGPVDPETGLASYSGNFSAKSKLSSFSLRLDAPLTPNQHLFGRINVGTSSGDWVDSTRQLPSIAYKDVETATTKTATVGLSSSGARFANELRLNVSTSSGSDTGSPSQLATGSLPLDLLLPPYVSRNSLAAGNSFVNIVTGLSLATPIQAGQIGDSVQTQAQVADTFSVSSKRHDWHFGIDARWSFATTHQANLYTYRFSDFAVGKIRNATETRTLPARALFTTFAAFAEDKFRVSKRLTVNYGVRYSVEPAPSSRDETDPYFLDAGALPAHDRADRSQLWNTAWSNVAPRVAATYQFGTGTGHESTFRGGWGVSFDTLNRIGGGAFGAGYPYNRLRFLQIPNNTPFPVAQTAWNQPWAEPFDPTDRNLYFAFPKDFSTPRTYSWQLGLDQAIGGNQRLGVTYAGAAGRDLPYLYFNAVGFSRIDAFSSDGRSDYNGLLTEYAWRLSRGLQVQLNYTWSHSIDLDSGEMVAANAPLDILTPASNRGDSDFDRRHVLQTTASYQFPTLRGDGMFSRFASDWQVEGVLVLRSGAPFTVTSTRDLGNGQGQFALRPDVIAGVPVWIPDATAPGGNIINPAAFTNPGDETQQGTLGRNTYRAFPLRQLDFSLSRSIHLGGRLVARFRIDAFNVLNLANFGPPLADLLVPADQFGRPPQSYATALGSGTLVGGGLVPIQQVGGPRSVQLGLKFTF